MKTKSQIEVSDSIESLVKDVLEPIDAKKLILIRDLMYSKLEVRDYNETTAEHEKSIRWKRTATEILNDGYVYKGKACTDLVVLFIALCRVFDLETRFVKVKKNAMVHSVAEIKLNDGWYIFDISNQNNFPIKGEITDVVPYKDWQLWKKGRDAWELGLLEFDCIKKIQ